MKKIVLIAAIALFLLIGTMIALPILFKDKLYEKAKTEMNEALNAKVELGELKVSLFRRFPKVFVEISNISLTGVDAFNEQKLATIGSVSTTINLSGLWSKTDLEINDITITKPYIQLVVNEEGLANWDVVAASAETSETSTSEQSKGIRLNAVEIMDATCSFIDKQAAVGFTMSETNLNFSGELKGVNSQLHLEGAAKNIEFETNGIKYVQNMTVELNTALKANFETMKFELSKNEIKINHLPVVANGSFTINDDNYDFDINFKSSNAALNELLNFVPVKYESYIEGVDTGGDVAFNGYFKGVYNEETFPALKVMVNLKNGRLKYEKMPEEIEKLELDAILTKEQGAFDLLVFDINHLDAAVAGNKLKGEFHLSTPISDPYLKGQFNGNVDFASLRNVIPMDSLSIDGLVEAQFAFEGNYSAIEKQDYQSFKTVGQATVSDFSYSSSDLPQKIFLSDVSMQLAPEGIKLNRCIGKTGQSDFNVKGKLNNYWPYLMSNKTLIGNFTLNSRRLDLNPFIVKTDTDNTPSETDTVSSQFYEIPDNLFLTFQANVDLILYDRMKISNSKGKLVVKDKKIKLDNMTMNMLQGEVVMSGIYATPSNKSAEFNLDMKVKALDIPSAYASLSTVRSFMPIAANSTGQFTSGFKLKGKLNDEMEPVLRSFNGAGDFSGNNVVIVGAKVFNEIGKYFKKDQFKKVTVDDFYTKFKIVNGGLEISAFDTKIAGQEATISGHQTVRQDLDYLMDFKVNKNDLSGEMSKYLGFVPGMDNIEKLPVGVVIAGTFKEPDVKVDMSKAKKVIEAEFKKSSKKELENAAKKLVKEWGKIFK